MSRCISSYDEYFYRAISVKILDRGGTTMYVDYIEVGRRIAERRKELGLKQGVVNEMAGLSDKYLSNIETARSIPSIDVLMRICDVLNITPDYLLVGAIEINEESDLGRLMMSKFQSLDREQQQFLCDFADFLIARGK